jgi:hypothetical protein
MIGGNFSQAFKGSRLHLASVEHDDTAEPLTK